MYDARLAMDYLSSQLGGRTMSFICEGDQVLVDHDWFVVDEVDEDTVFCLDKDGGEHEFNIGDVFVLD